MSGLAGEAFSEEMLDDYDLEQGKSVRGWLWFDIGRDVVLSDFRYRPSAEMGGVQGEWRLGAAGD